MKKLFMMLVLSSTFVFAGTETTSSVPAVSAEQSAMYAKVVTAVKDLVTTSFKQGKEHYLIAGTAVAAAGVIALYYTNADCKKMIQSWLGLTEVIAQK